jgi:hypothetical protein
MAVFHERVVQSALEESTSRCTSPGEDTEQIIAETARVGWVAGRSTFIASTTHRIFCVLALPCSG